jgi:hypothetical protein
MAGITEKFYEMDSTYAGVVQMANEPGYAVSKIAEAVPLVLKAKTKEEMQRGALYAINTLASGPYPMRYAWLPEIWVYSGHMVGSSAQLQSEGQQHWTFRRRRYKIVHNQMNFIFGCLFKINLKNSQNSLPR